MRDALLLGAVELGVAPEDAGAGIMVGARALAALGSKHSPAGAPSSEAAVHALEALAAPIRPERGQYDRG